MMVLRAVVYFWVWTTVAFGGLLTVAGTIGSIEHHLAERARRRTRPMLPSRPPRTAVRLTPTSRTADERKTATETRVHATECVRCGPSGKPAPPGSPWSDAHRHADALRIVGKTILRDLWTVTPTNH